MTAFCAAFDWGTTSLRAWLLDHAGTVLSESSGPDGILNVETGAYDAILKYHLQNMQASPDLPVVVCGMAGARQGWHEAAYLDVPSHLDQICLAATRIPDLRRDVRILPGMAQRSAGKPDVMRGEETQLLGLQQQDALVCIPGTHSKWVEIRDGAVQRFATHMTGELYALLSEHSILRHAVGNAETQREQGFRAGVDMMLQPDAALGQALFSVRARGLVADDPGNGSAYLSGLLIGAEVAAARAAYDVERTVILLAAGDLAGLYDTALLQGGFMVQRADLAFASRKGLLQAARHIWGDDE